MLDGLTSLPVVQLKIVEEFKRIMIRQPTIFLTLCALSSLIVL